MTIPIRFPDPMQEARERAEEYQRLSSEQRLYELADMVNTGFFLVRNSPHREAIDRVSLDHELAWRRIQQELFANYGKRRGPDSVGSD